MHKKTISPFYIIRRATVRSQVFLPFPIAIFLFSFRGKRVKASVLSITYYALLQNIGHYCKTDSYRKRTVVRINYHTGVLFHLLDFNQIVLLGKSEINEFWYTCYIALENLWRNTSVMRD